MSNAPKTWREAVQDLEKFLERKPTLYELLALARNYNMTDEEVKAQRESWSRQDMD